MPSRRSMLKYTATGLAAIAANLKLPTMASAAGTYDVGASDTEIKIGNTMPYSGPASSFGQAGKTVAAYYRKLNEEGGVNGRMINFLSYDDAYSPPKTVEQTRKLVESDEVLLIFYPSGTAQAVATRDYLNEQKIPQLFLGSGASITDPAQWPYTMQWQPSTQAEGIFFGRYISENLPDAKIGVLSQNDDFGKTLLLGLKEGLGGKASQIVDEQTYETSDPTVDARIVSLKASGADVFVNLSTPKFAAQAIRKVKDVGWDCTQFLTRTSSPISAVLEPAGLGASTGIISTSFLKDPSDPQWANDQGVIDYVAFMDKYYPDGDKFSWYNSGAYAVAQLLVKVLEQAGDNLTRENIMQQARNLKDVTLPMLLPGMTANTSDTDYFPLEQSQMIRFTGKHWETIGELMSTTLHRG